MPQGPARRPQMPRSCRGTTGSEETALFSLLRYSHIFSAAVHERLECEPLRDATTLPLTPAHLHLLRLIAADGRYRLGAAARFLGVSPPAATKSIDKLERLSLVERTPTDEDRRARLLALSAKGRNLVRRYEEHRAESLSPILAALRQEEIEEFTDLLRRFALLLLSTGNPAPGRCLRCAAHVENQCPVAGIQGGCPSRSSRAFREKSDARAESAPRVPPRRSRRSSAVGAHSTRGSKR